MKANKKIKALWCETLREEGLLQVKRKLRDEDTGGMCCLGVLCELASHEGMVVPTTHDYINSVEEGDMGQGILPNVVRDWIGLDWKAGIPLLNWMGKM